MGMNYYLKLKKTDILYEIINTLDYYFDLYHDVNNVIKLKNGFVWQETFYPDLDSLAKDYYLNLHIGKSSYGWHFNLCIYPKLGIDNLEDWEKLFTNKDNIIVNEEDEIISPEAMILTIVNRSHPDKDRTDEDILENINNVNDKLGFDTYKSYQEFLNANHAEKGLNGLLAHKSSIYSKHIRTKGTYDLTEDYNFS